MSLHHQQAVVAIVLSERTQSEIKLNGICKSTESQYVDIQGHILVVDQGKCIWSPSSPGQCIRTNCTFSSKLDLPKSICPGSHFSCSGVFMSSKPACE